MDPDQVKKYDNSVDHILRGASKIMRFINKVDGSMGGVVCTDSDDGVIGNSPIGLVCVTVAHRLFREAYTDRRQEKEEDLRRTAVLETVRCAGGKLPTLLDGKGGLFFVGSDVPSDAAEPSEDDSSDEGVSLKE